MTVGVEVCVTPLTHLTQEKWGAKEELAEKGGVDAVNVAAFDYDTYTSPSKRTGCLAQRLQTNPGAHRDAATKQRKLCASIVCRKK